MNTQTAQGPCQLCMYLLHGGAVSRFPACKDNTACANQPSGTVCPCRSSEAGQVTYQVTADSKVVAEFSNGYDATQYACGLYTKRAARGKVIAVRRSDGK